MHTAQQTLFATDAVGFDRSFRGIRRISLGGSAWLEHLPGWLSGHEAVFEELRSALSWRDGERKMYDRMVDVPRLMATLPDDGCGHPVLDEMREALGRRYGLSYGHVHLHRYRRAEDSVAMHADSGREGELEVVLPIVSLGTPRRFLVRPGDCSRRALVGAARRARSFQLGWGDLFVMGGSTAFTWEHGVPKVAHVDGERISIMFRRDRLTD